MVFYLHHLKPQFILAIVFLFIPILIGQFIRISIISKYEDETAPIVREYDYLKSVITNKEYFKETSILGLFQFFISRLLTSLIKLSKSEWQKVKKTNVLESIISFFTISGYVAVLLLATCFCTTKW